MQWKDLDSKVCSIKRALPLFGDRWTIAIIRDAFIGASRFSDFQESLGISKHRLSDRLARLTQDGILERRQDNGSHPSYHLSQKGLDLSPVLLALAQWGDKYMDDGDGQPLLHIHSSCGNEIKPELTCSDCGEAITADSYAIKPGPGIKAKLARGEDIPELTMIAKMQRKEEKND